MRVLVWVAMGAYGKEQRMTTLTEGPFTLPKSLTGILGLDEITGGGNAFPTLRREIVQIQHNALSWWPAAWENGVSSIDVKAFV